MIEDETPTILKRLRNDDRAALRLLFQQYYGGVCKSIFRYIKNKATVEDLAQDVFMKVWEKRHTISVNSSFGPYLNRMGINEALSLLRKQQRRAAKEPEILPFANPISPSVEEEYLHLELDQKITKAINSLPPRCQVIFKMSRFEELSYREIAEKLEISIKTVEHQMGKSLRILRTLLIDLKK